MSKRSYIFPVGLALFVIAVALYFQLSDRGRNDIVIPSLDAVSADPANLEELFVLSPDFDDPAVRGGVPNFSGNGAHSGNFVQSVDKKHEYSFGITGSWSAYKSAFRVREVRFSAWLFAHDSLKDVVMVFAIDSASGASAYWQSVPVQVKAGGWSRFSSVFTIPLRYLNPELHYKLYIWNKSGQEFQLDDLNASFYGIPLSGFTGSDDFASRTAFMDFETLDSEHLVTDQARSGKKALRLSSELEYAPGIDRFVHETTPAKINLVTLGVWIYPEEEDINALLVATIRRPDGSEYVWEGRSTDKGSFPLGKWSKHRAQFKLPEQKIGSGDKISAYVWNKGRTRLLIDDFEVVYGEQQARAGGEPLIDMSTVPEEGIPYTKNLPPFPASNYAPVAGTSYDFNPVEELNDSSNRWTPSDILVAASVARGTSLTQIVRIHNNSLELYGYCTSARRLIRFFSAQIPFRATHHAATAVDTDGDGLQEIFVVARDGKGYLVHFPGNLNTCVPASAGSGQFIADAIPLPGGADTMGTKYLVMQSGQPEPLMLFDRMAMKCHHLKRTGDAYALIETQWTEEAPERTLMQVLWDDAGRMHCVFSDSGRKLVRAYRWNEEGQRFLEVKPGEFPPLYLFRHETELMKLPKTAVPGSGYILINEVPRFGISHITSGMDGLIVESQAEFRETPVDRNPKFFETRSMLAGKFLPQDGYQILAVMANCNDTAYKGGPCRDCDTSGGIVMFTQK
jgi:hypothetical protein